MSMEMNQVVAVVLAGGFGRRVQHLLPDVPKPMAPVAGRPFLEWLVRYLARQGVRKVVLSTGHLAEVVERHFQSQPVRGVMARCVAETVPLGTAGGFLHAARVSGERPPSWLVLNGDSLVFADLATMARALDDAAVAGVMLGRDVPDASRYGTLVSDATGDLLRFAEKQPGRGVISAGVYLLRHSTLDAFPDRSPLSFETEVFPALLARRARLRVVVTSAPFLDVGTPETLPQAEAFIRANLEQFQA